MRERPLPASDLVRLRESAGHSLPAAAAKLGLSEGQLRNLEAGRSDTRTAKALDLARLYLPQEPIERALFAVVHAIQKGRALYARRARAA